MPGARYQVILNARAGTALTLGITAEKLRLKFLQAGLTAIVDNEEDEPLEGRVKKAVAGPCPIVVAAGGDGTVGAVARALVGTDKTLCILPLGTVNKLARDLKIPLDLDGAVSALASMHPRRIDVGEVNGRLFLDMVVIGLIPGLAAGREHIRGKGGWAVLLALSRFFYRRLKRTRSMALQVGPHTEKASVQRVKSAAVANNEYAEGVGRFFSKKQLDGGSLALYLLKQSSVGTLVRLAVKMVMGRWRKDSALITITARQARIRSRKAKLQVMLDGEIETFSGTLHFSIRPLALSVLAPPFPSQPSTRP